MPAAPLDHRIHAPPGGLTRARPSGEFVLYWLQTTMRAHDNFALNFAVEQANELGLPVLVYHGLRHDYPWASDRFHTWILESVADLYGDFEEKGIQYCFWLDRSVERWGQGSGRRGQGAGETTRRSARRGDRTGDRGVHPPSTAPLPLVSLADRAALVVTDYFPTFIVPRQIQGLRRKTETPVVAVDSATVVPMGWHEKQHATARGIRPVLLNALPHFLWPVPNPEPRLRRPVEIPFDDDDTRRLVALRGDGVALQAAIGELVSRCAVDHTVPPSPSFRGGSRAGRERLRQFLRDGLRSYDERNDPTKPESVSRLSPWLHFGNLSIHEVLLAAREAGPADQYASFLDEALTWRELAHNFCHFDPKHRTATAIPPWAQRELAAHESDPRPRLYTLEEMEEARTDEPLWNAAQCSYLRDGWMHNYMRMLWGKTVLQWTANAVDALRILEHLNNKYALDGRDPNSYGGIHWIFGKFDRPFYRRPIYGMVRYMSLRAAREKFDVGRYVGMNSVQRSAYSVQGAEK
ncbi:MAG TPA: deoxyribodipyrimidine photo-lyase [Gemmatimonadales bacterium]|nr:deoxyribodipyrimidine photo-lyase [Gemmatimonadales bacterium]